ncbi:MAG: hypothetical protein EBU90_19220 [Proteobacteria bacterium]|nr:hypothetical protein [Pseudomonadota bacterium]NBP14464.1 hypothetical protein [bacterium]
MVKKYNFSSLDVVRLGSWLIKISSLDGNILLNCFNPSTGDYQLHCFVDEIDAFEQLERFYAN